MALIYVVHEFPARTQTFVEREIAALRQQGRDVHVYPLQGDTVPFSVRRLLFHAPHVRRLWRALAEVRTRSVTRREVPRQLYALLHGMNVAAWGKVGRHKTLHLHAHFVARCVDVTAYAEIFLEGDSVVTTATGHAAEVLLPSSSDLLRRRVAGLDAVVAASDAVNRALFQATGREGVVVHCGVERQPPWRPWSPSRQVPLRLLTVARLVEKKNIGRMLDVAEWLRAQGVSFEWKIVGDGPLREALLRRREHLRLDTVTLVGHLSGRETLNLVEEWADVFVLVPVRAPSGDVDGIPVALMEAMAASVPVVSSDVGGVCELVVDGVTGVIVDPLDASAIGTALLDLTADSAQTSQLTRQAYVYVETNFRADHEASKMAVLFDELDAQLSNQGRR